MTMTEGPTGPKTGAPELFMASAASLPARSACGFALGCCPSGPGVQGPQPRGKGELQGAAVGALGSSLPQAGRAGRRAWCTGQEVGADWRGLSCLARQIFAPLCPAWAAGLPRSKWPGQEPFRPPSLLCSTPGLSHPWGSQHSTGHPGLSAVHIPD